MNTTPDFAGKPAVTKPPKGGEFFDMVEPLKAFTDETGYSAYDNEQLLESCFMLSLMNDSALTSGVNAYAQYYAGDLASKSKLMLILRMLCNVPEFLPMSQAKSYGSWVLPPGYLTATQRNVLWPLTMSPGPYPFPQVTYPYLGYVGAPYDPVAELQFFLEMFGRRTF